MKEGGTPQNWFAIKLQKNTLILRQVETDKIVFLINHSQEYIKMQAILVLGKLVGKTGVTPTSTMSIYHS